MRKSLAAMLVFALGCGGAVTEEQQASPVPLHLYVVTSGADLDPDGYVAKLDQQWRVAVASNGQAMFDAVPPGRHSLALDGIADNCKVNDGNPQTISLDAGGPQAVQLNVSCLPGTGTLEAMVNNVGTAAIRGNAFRLAVPQGLCIFDFCGFWETIYWLSEDSSLLISVNTGEKTLTLTPPANCEVRGSNPRTVTVVAQQTQLVVFEVFCR